MICNVMNLSTVVWSRSLALSRLRMMSVVKRESWRGDQESDNLPKVKKRDGTVGDIAKTRGLVDYHRIPDPYRDPLLRVFDWQEISYETPQTDAVQRQVQAARCMDCGTPFCQTHTGCPVNNLIPEWNELVFKQQWKYAIDRLHKTNNFPEFTGRVCPAPCEAACVAGIIDNPVTIKNIEYSIVDKAWAEGWIVPRVPKRRTGKKVAIVGSGPAGLAAADCLNQLGHSVTVYEREDQVGGLLTYGIPNMKLKKETVTRRVNLLAQEGIEFSTSVEIGKTLSAADLKSSHDAIVLCVGSTMPRDLRVPGRELGGIHFAMEFLTGNQKRLLLNRAGQLQSVWGSGAAGKSVRSQGDGKGTLISAEGKDVVVIGGGDTGTDCIGTSMRQHCRSITNIELMPRPPDSRSESNPWPQWPRVYGVDYGHAEAQAVFGADPRAYGLAVTEFKGRTDDSGAGGSKSGDQEEDQGEGEGAGAVVTAVVAQETQPGTPGAPGRGTAQVWPADLVILAMGFVAPESSQLCSQLDLHLDQRNNIHALYGDFRTNAEGVFAAGDCRRGQSLVVWAINEGRGVAQRCHEFLSAK